MLLFRKPDPIKVLEREANRLNIALGKLMTAHNIVERARRERVDKFLIQTALTGVPLSSRDLANIYISSVVKDLKKTLVSINKLDNYLKTHYPTIYYTHARNRLDELNNILSRILERYIDNVERSIELLTIAISRIKELETILASHRLWKTGG